MDPDAAAARQVRILLDLAYSAWEVNERKAQSIWPEGQEDFALAIWRFSPDEDLPESVSSASILEAVKVFRPDVDLSMIATMDPLDALKIVERLNCIEDPVLRSTLVPTVTISSPASDHPREDKQARGESKPRPRSSYQEAIQRSTGRILGGFVAVAKSGVICLGAVVAWSTFLLLFMGVAFYLMSIKNEVLRYAFLYLVAFYAPSTMAYITSRAQKGESIRSGLESIFWNPFNMLIGGVATAIFGFYHIVLGGGALHELLGVELLVAFLLADAFLPKNSKS